MVVTTELTLTDEKMAKLLRALKNLGGRMPRLTPPVQLAAQHLVEMHVTRALEVALK
jgi:hypothetical protein